MKIKDDDKEDPVYFDEYNSEDLLKIIETHTEITNYMKQQKKTKMFNVLVIVDDFADNPYLAAIVNYYMLYILVVDMLFCQR